jgi:hypothetical protein
LKINLKIMNIYQRIFISQIFKKISSKTLVGAR